MIDRTIKQYEFIAKLLIIVVLFLVISMVFGYYWLLLENHSGKTSDLITDAIELYYNGNDFSENSENAEIHKGDKFKNISVILAKGERSFLITNVLNGNETPVVWNNLPISDEPSASLEFCKKNNVKPIIYKKDFLEMHLYYSPDDLIYKVRYYPFFLLGSIVLIIFMTGYLYMFMRRNEKQSLWIAMSKETAHQLGTPLTSLNGWREYLTELSKENDEFSQFEEGLREDIEKIGLIVERFSKISSEKEFKMCDLKHIIEKSADYISKRITIDSDKITIVKMLDRVSGIYANAVLIEWTIENLLKNSIESLKDGENGEIIIKLFEEKEKIIIEVCDNGSGIPSSIKKNVFETGFTTKKRGWGLGLSLSKKVISQYHKGSIFIKQTGQKGTVFRIELNKYV